MTHEAKPSQQAFDTLFEYLNTKPENPLYRYELVCARTHPYLYSAVYSPTVNRIGDLTPSGTRYRTAFMYSYALELGTQPNLVITEADTEQYIDWLAIEAADDVLLDNPDTTEVDALAIGRNLVAFGNLPKHANNWVNDRLYASEALADFYVYLEDVLVREQMHSNHITDASFEPIKRGMIDASYIFNHSTT